MLVICEDCAKKYNVDETRIKGKKARFSCRECGHIIVVEKPVAVEARPESPSMSNEEVMALVMGVKSSEETKGRDTTVTNDEKNKNNSTNVNLTITLVVGMLVVCGIFAYLYINK